MEKNGTADRGTPMGTGRAAQEFFLPKESER
jgi:hypothetical protein